MLETVPTPVVSSPRPAERLRRDPRTIRTAAILAGLAFALSTLGSWIPSFWGDEAASIMSAERPLPSLFVELGNVDAVHGTYYLFLHFWIGVFGASPLSVRMPSALAVGAAVFGVVLLAERLASYRVAVLAGCVCVLLPRVTYMGEEARSYALSAACAVWLTVLLVRALGRHESRVMRWWPYALLLAASAYVFLFTMLIVVAHLAIILTVTRSWRVVRAWGAAVLAAVIAASPLIYWALRERKQISYLQSADAVNTQTLGVDQWFGNIAVAILAWGLIAVGAVVGVRALLRARGRRRGQIADAILTPRGRATAFRAAGILTPREAGMPSLFVVAAAWAFIPMLLLLAGDLASAMYTVRYLSFAAPAVALLIGLVLALPARRWISVVGLVTVLAASVPTYLYQRTPFAKNESDWAQIADTIKTHATKGDAVVFDQTFKPSRRPRLALHTYPAAFAGLGDPTLAVPFQDNTWWWDQVHQVGTVAGKFRDIDRVWAVEYRLPGAPADTWGMPQLRALGYTVTAEYRGHRSIVYELSR
ncbi:glycosyltransferase family 39 protein [Diaminobutyricibacter sp. McL0608]|uniref:glycosyltransferase family 39 protein n=1 Tax=Leifsonia sp. McL0608 TaxID=3143537 RepID=UPI0031F30385